MYVANVFMLFSGIIVAKLFSNFRKLRYSILGPCIFVFATVGAFGISNSMSDVWIMFAFGLLGYVMKKFSFSVAPLIIALVLGGLAEESLRRGMRMEDYDLVSFLARPISGTMSGGSRLDPSLHSLQQVQQKTQYPGRRDNQTGGDVCG